MGSNGDNNNNSPNFFVTWDVVQDQSNGSAMLPGDSIYLFLDDGGAANDDNHDDMVIRITASSPVPEPPTMILFGLGLLGLAGVSRKKNLK